MQYRCGGSAVYRSCSDLLPITRPPPVNDSYCSCEYVGALRVLYNGPRSTLRLSSSDGLILKANSSSRREFSYVLITILHSSLLCIYYHAVYQAADVHACFPGYALQFSSASATSFFLLPIFSWDVCVLETARETF